MESESHKSSSIGTLLSTLLNEVSALVRGEAALAKAEMSEKTHQAMAGVGAVATAGAVLFAALEEVGIRVKK